MANNKISKKSVKKPNKHNKSSKKSSKKSIKKSIKKSSKKTSKPLKGNRKIKNLKKKSSSKNIDSVEVTCRSEKSKENYVEEAHISSQQLWMVLFKNIPIRQL